MADFHHDHTPLDEIPTIRDKLRASFEKGLARPISWRRQQLYQVARMVQENAEALSKAIADDFGKPRMETYAIELTAIVERSLRSAECLEDWTKPEHVNVPVRQQAWSPTVFKTPKGVVLIFSPFNLPTLLSLLPLIGAIAAGCCAVIKPSELVPHHARLLAELVNKYLDSSAYVVVNGAITEATRLLELQWDHIFYTGSSHVARVVCTAAAKYLTPVTLELGGKCPAIIDPEAGTDDVKLAAKRALWGKVNNAGQTCLAPDYVIIRRDQQEEFINALKEHHGAFFPDGALQSPSFARIVTHGHHARLVSLLERTQGTIAFGGKFDDKKGLEPTVVRDVRGDDSLMEEEIFGPIFPLIPVDNIDEAIAFVKSRPHPLALYVFTDNPALKQRFVDTTLSGALVFNDTIMHATVCELPFGGIGDSGYGTQNLRHTFDCFTHLRSSVDMPKQAEPFLQVRYPPYTEDKFKIMTGPVGLPIPN